MDLNLAKRMGYNPKVKLRDQTANWSTPRAIYGEHSGMVDKDHLTGQAIEALRENRYSNGDTATWPTPGTTINTKTYRVRADGRQGLTLEGRVTLWQTPVAYSARYRRQVRQKVRGERLLPARAEDGIWATPIGRDYKDGAMDPEAPTPTNSILGRQVLRTGLPVPTNGTSGPESSSGGPSSRRPPSRPRLNPRFVTWLQGFPQGWADPERRIERANFALWEMRSSRQVRRTLSGSSGPDSRTTD